MCQIHRIHSDVGTLGGAGHKAGARCHIYAASPGRTFCAETCWLGKLQMCYLQVYGGPMMVQLPAWLHCENLNSLPCHTQGLQVGQLPRKL